ncbi:MAG: hemolysin III family protein [Planctomycetales bacterium]
MNKYNIESVSGFAEPVASWSHFFGAALFFVLSIVLLRGGWRAAADLPAATRWARMFSLALFCFSAVSLFSVSGVYHLLGFRNEARDVMLRVDYAFIFALIASTYTPIMVYLLKGILRWLPLLLIWSAAITGIVLFAVFGEIPIWFSVTLMAGLGWSGIYPVIVLLKRYGFRFVEPVLSGAAAYTIGAAIQAAGEPMIIQGVLGPHEIFHIAVILGALCHWKFIHTIATSEPVRIA